MPTVKTSSASLHYEETGQGFPILAFAPGGMRSAISVWESKPINPLVALRDRYRVIAMDQRNAGASSAPVRATDGWETYTQDHVALLDHLGIDRCHVVGMCIGCSFSLGLIRAAPERVASAVMFQPIGLLNNRQVFYELFDSWSAELRTRQPDVADATWTAFRERMYGGDFVFNVDEQFVRSVRQPLLVLLGDDIYHPSAISRELATLAPSAELVERWKEPDAIDAATLRIRDFLDRNTPG